MRWCSLRTHASSGESRLIPYRATAGVPHELVEHVSWLVCAQRRELDPPWRRLGCFKQALFVLAHLRKNETFAQLATGFGVSIRTAWRYADETSEVLAARAPGLHEALTGLAGGDPVIADGTRIPTDRITADRPYYSRKHRKHGMNVQVIARPDGTPLWFSRATPPTTPDRGPGERTFAQLKSRRLLRRARYSTRRTGTIIQAVHTVLTCSYSK
ncbi:transposase family protein [Streptomyces sp. NPDC056069]|uniref:transposase family protein n=1 Tax=Streptomyces sp. NPDC056069 TaxID=3345702 RepID=UPI0035D976C9